MIKNLKSLTFENTILAVISIRFLGAILHCFAPVTMPHTWRQVDTMGVALRYALRWTVDDTDISWWIPAVLNSSDTTGVMAMEFPFLDFVGAVGFYLAGHNLELGRSLSQLFALTLNSLIVFLALNQWKTITREKPSHFEFPLAVLGAGVLSFASPYTSKFMPDLTAMLLAVLGTAGIWRLRLWGVIPLALAVLIKPTSCVVASLLLLHPMTLGFIGKALTLLIASASTAAIWYLKVVPYLKSLQEKPGLFTIPDQPHPLENIFQFWTAPGVRDVLDFHAVFPFGWVVVLGAVIWLRKQMVDFSNLVLLVVVLLLQATVIGALSGRHSEMHSYYLIGLTPVAILLIGQIWNTAPHLFLRYSIAIVLLVKAGEGLVADTRGFWDDRQGAAWFAECKQLRELKPDAPWRKNLVWRTPIEEFPLIDLCIGERGQSEKSSWGVFRKVNSIPANCKVEAESARLNLVHCDS